MLTAVLLSVLSSPLFAQQPKMLAPCLKPNDPRCAVDLNTVVTTTLGPGAASEDIVPPSGSSLPGAVDVDHVINTALRIWDIIVKNKPVVDIKTQYAVALPQGITNWGQLAGWKPPEGTVYGFYAKNGFGQTVVNVRYLVTRTYGGSYNGKGKYLTAVTIQPLNVDVSWGYKFSLGAQAPEQTIGNFGTADDPVAGMSLVVNWTVETPVKSANGTSVYFLEGDGTFREDGSPFPQGYSVRARELMSRAAALQLP